MANETLKLRILSYVCEFEDRNGYAPSYREIQRAAGIKSVSTVHDYVRRLEAEGRLSIKVGHPRALTANRRIRLPDNAARRVRVEVADGGVLFLDCFPDPAGSGGTAVAFSGVMDASLLKGRVGSVVGCSFEDE